MPAGYDSSGGLFLFGGSWLVVVLALVTGDWDSLVSLSRAQPRDLYCTVGISVYALRGNDVLVLPHIRR